MTNPNFITKFCVREYSTSKTLITFLTLISRLCTMIATGKALEKLSLIFYKSENSH